MKRKLIFMLTVLLCSFLWAEDKPSWVKQHPVNDFGFAGVGMANKSENNYQQKAKQNALADLVSEINISISTQSLLNSIDDDGTVKQSFAESIRSAAKAEIESYRLVDSWQGNSEYWVYYELNRADYDKYMEARRQKAIQNGFDFWYKGHVTMEQGDLMTAIELFSKGMEAIEPAINQELLCSYEGKTINLGTELYAALAGAFNGVTIVMNPTAIAGTPFQEITAPVAVGAYRNGNPLKNMRLKAEFISGTGDVSELAPTNEAGVTALYIRNITSKQSQQQIKASIQNNIFQAFTKGSYGALFKKVLSMLPEAVLTIHTEQAKVAAYVKWVQNDMDMLERGVKSILANNYFNMAASASVADIVVTLDNKLKKGRIIPGELYNFEECFSSLSIQILDNRTNQTLMNYSINEIRTLVPENKSEAQRKNMVARELMKRLEREFNRELKKITFDRSGEIQETLEEADPALPTPIIDEPELMEKPTPVEYKPVAVPVVVPAPVIVIPPISEPNPTQKPKPQAIRSELTDGIFIEFVELTSMNDKSRIQLNIINETSDDFTLKLYHSNQTVINENGEELKLATMKIGSKISDYEVEAIIVPHLPTRLVIEVKKLQSVALLQLKDNFSRTVKLRNLK